MNISPFSKQTYVFMCLQHQSPENTVGKGEIARSNSVFYWFGELSTI